MSTGKTIASEDSREFKEPAKEPAAENPATLPLPPRVGSGFDPSKAPLGSPSDEFAALGRLMQAAHDAARLVLVQAGRVVTVCGACAAPPMPPAKVLTGEVSFPQSAHACAHDAVLASQHVGHFLAYVQSFLQETAESLKAAREGRLK